MANQHTATRWSTFEDQSIPEPNSGCWLWLGPTVKGGYGKLFIHGYWQLAHRMAWQRAYGDVPAGLFVCHHCDVACCVNPAHLFLGTHTDNMRDMMRKGRGPLVHGANNQNAKINEADALTIRASAENYHALAAQYGISYGQVYAIKTRRSWKSLP